jgi:hypothetical protein
MWLSVLLKRGQYEWLWVTLLCFTALFPKMKHKDTMKWLVLRKKITLYWRCMSGVDGLSLTSPEIVDGLTGLAQRENKLHAWLDRLFQAALFLRVRHYGIMELLVVREMMSTMKYEWSSCPCCVSWEKKGPLRTSKRGKKIGYGWGWDCVPDKVYLRLLSDCRRLWYHLQTTILQSF